MCRNAYNNRQNSNVNNLVRRVNGILKKNRRIMEEICPEGKVKTSRSKLVAKGFDFSYFTSTYTTKEGSIYHFCYDFGYLPLNEDSYLIVQRETD